MLGSPWWLVADRSSCDCPGAGPSRLRSTEERGFYAGPRASPLTGFPQRISQSILTLRMLCEMRYLLGARSVERSGPAGIDDHAAADAGATVVGLEAVSDVPHVGVLVVLAVGV